MDVRRVTELNMADIAAAIAEAHGVEPMQVSLRTEKQAVGYGMSERDEYVVVATIEETI